MKVRKMRRLARWSALLLGGLALLLLLTAAGGWLWLRTSLPNYDGELALSGLAGEVELLRDADGLLTIRAGTAEDAAFGLGFAHAQDRLGQMLLTRLVGEGRLSSIAGARSLPMDRLFRTMRLAELAAACLAHLEPATRRRLEAYAAGVNAYLESHGGIYAPETALLGLEVAPWRPQDSLLWGKLMALRLSGNWQQELDNARLAARFSPAELADLFPPDPPDSPTTRMSAVLPQTLLEALPPGLASDGASNVWAVSGRFTASGKPVLANDPHLRLQAPAEWYLARIETPERTLAGATAPGVPFILIGRNDRIAWGFTTTHSDTQDLVIERLAAQPDHYRTPEGPRAFEAWEVSIPVRGQPDSRFTLRRSRFGPVISDSFPETAAIAGAGGGDVVALAWPALTEDDTSADAILRLNEAESWSDFTAAMERFVAPQQNVFYADVEGNIGFYSPARVPQRIGYDGELPVAGWTRSALWSGFVPFEELPHAFNPPEGRLVNANNRLVAVDYPHLIAKRWPAPFRARRITEVLSAQERHRPEDSEALQRDRLSLAAREILPLLLAPEPAPGVAAEAHRLLAVWDGRMEPDRPEPLLFHAWLKALNGRIFADELGAELYPAVADWDTRRLLHVLTEAPRWCAGAAPDCETAIRESLIEALSTLEVEEESALAELEWGDFHKARLSHPLIGRLPVLGSLFDLELPVGGSDHTVERATPAFGGLHPFSSFHGAGLRAVFDLSDFDNSRFIISTGQSGNPLSPFYDNLSERWQEGNYIRLTPPEGAERYRLLLRPGEGSGAQRGG